MSTGGSSKETITAGYANEPLLQVSELSIEVRVKGQRYTAVDGVSFEIFKGETLALVGESGSGKSLTAQSIVGILPRRVASIASGSVEFEGHQIGGKHTNCPRAVRAQGIAMVFQDPLSALNPILRVGDQIAELFRSRKGASRKEARDAALDVMGDVGIPDVTDRFRQYPHELSGGLRQRVMIAMAVALRPRLLIADEPTTALDVTVQAQIMELFERLKDEYGLSILLITHDLALVAEEASRAVVLYGGRVMETGAVRELYERTGNPYTVSLLRSVPEGAEGSLQAAPIPGSPPDLFNKVDGCAFHPRCYLAHEVCSLTRPPLQGIDAGSSPFDGLPAGRDSHRSACHFIAECRNSFVAPE